MRNNRNQRQPWPSTAVACVFVLSLLLFCLLISWLDTGGELSSVRKELAVCEQDLKYATNEWEKYQQNYEGTLDELIYWKEECSTLEWANGELERELDSVLYSQSKQLPSLPTLRRLSPLYVGSVNSDIYHYPSCGQAGKIKSYNEIWFDSVSGARSSGYFSCSFCKPPRE